MAEELRILAVDDEEGMRLGIERILAPFSFELAECEASIRFTVDTAESGEEATDKLAAGAYDILLLDHKMKGISGLDVLAWIKDRDCPVLTIMVTAYASLDTAVEAMKRGAHDFLAKPFTPDEIRSVVKKTAGHLVTKRRAQALAEEKRRVRFEFISVLAHELKAPLGAIEGYLQILRDGTASDPETVERMLDRSLARLQGMRKLIYDLLDMTRIESGTKPRELEQLDLRALAAQSVETLLPDAQARGITIELPVGPPVQLSADRSELEIVFNNLVSNAVKYNRDNGRVEIAITKDGPHVLISVSDTGIGMTAEESARLCKEFVRIKNAKTRNIMGTGLGLSTVKKIAALYGGDVAVSSAPDVGTTFTVTLNTA
ncbi:response regulator [bacterium]|nr:response regulator [bacterium]